MSASCCRHNKNNGWSYNENSACDSDSTSWAIRFLGRLDALSGQDPGQLLTAYVIQSLLRIITLSALHQTWKPDALLLVPEQFQPNNFTQHLDKGLMTGATLLLALKKIASRA